MSTDLAKKLYKFEDENPNIPVHNPFELKKQALEMRERKLQERAEATVKRIEPSALVKKMQEER